MKLLTRFFALGRQRPPPAFDERFNQAVAREYQAERKPETKGFEAERFKPNSPTKYSVALGRAAKQRPWQLETMFVSRWQMERKTPKTWENAQTTSLESTKQTH